MPPNRVMATEPQKAMTRVGTAGLDAARLHLAQRREQRGARGDDGEGIERARHRLDDQQRAEKSHADGGPAPPADQFAIDDHRQDRDQERRDLKDGGHARHGKLRQGGDEAEGREPVIEGAHGEQPVQRPAQLRTMAERDGEAADDRGGHQPAHEDDRADRMTGEDLLHQGVVACVGAHAAEDRDNAALIGAQRRHAIPPVGRCSQILGRLVRPDRGALSNRP